MNIEPLPLPIAEQTEPKLSAIRIFLAVLPWILTAALAMTNVWTLVSERTRLEGRGILLPLISTVWRDSATPLAEITRHTAVVATGETAETLAARNVVLATRKRELESVVSRLQRENIDIKAQKVDADSRLASLQTEHVSLQNQHVELEKEQRVLKDLTVRRAKAVKTVADRISRKLAIHAGELIAELPLRAAPYVGVFTLVTGTALDVKSDCELARTLNGLVVEHDEAPLNTHAVCQYTDKIPAPAQVWSAVKSQAGTLAAPVYQTVERLYR